MSKEMQPHPRLRVFGPTAFSEAVALKKVRRIGTVSMRPVRFPADWIIAALLDAALMLAIALRCWRLFGDICADEWLTLATIAKPWSGLFAFAARDWVHPPGYYLLLKAWALFAGVGGESIRLFSALCGVASVWLTFHLGAALGSSRAGAFGALLTALSSVHIFYSQLGRAYALEGVWALLLLWAAVRWACAPQSFRWRWITGVAALGLVATHVLGWLMVAAASVWVWRHVPSGRRVWSFWLGACIAMTFAWLAFVRPPMRHYGADLYLHWIARPSLIAPLTTLKEFHGWIGLRAFSWAIALVWWMPIAHALAFCRYPQVRWLLFWSLAPIVALWLASRIAVPMYLTRYVLMAAPVYYLAVAFALERVPLADERWTIRVVVLIWSVLGCIALLTQPARLPLDALAQHVRAWPADAPVVAERTYLMNPLWHRLKDERDVRVLGANHLLVPPANLEVSWDDIAGYDRFGIVYYNPETAERLNALIASGYDVLDRGSLSGPGQQRELQTIHWELVRRKNVAQNPR